MSSPSECRECDIQRIVRVYIHTHIDLRRWSKRGERNKRSEEDNERDTWAPAAAHPRGAVDLPAARYVRTHTACIYI